MNEDEVCICTHSRTEHRQHLDRPNEVNDCTRVACDCDQYDELSQMPRKADTPFASLSPHEQLLAAIERQGKRIQSLEEVVLTLAGHLGIKPLINTELNLEEQVLSRRSLIDAIKAFRTRTASSLGDAKRVVEQYRRESAMEEYRRGPHG